MTFAIFVLSCFCIVLLSLSAALALFLVKPDDENRFGGDEIKQTIFVSLLMGLFTFFATLAVFAVMNQNGMGLASLAVLPVLVASVAFGAKLFYAMDFLSSFYFALIIFGIFSLLIKFGPYIGLGLPMLRF